MVKVYHEERRRERTKNWRKHKLRKILSIMTVMIMVEGVTLFSMSYAGSGAFEQKNPGLNYGLIYSNLESTRTNMGKFHVKLVGHHYTCNQNNEHTHLKTVVYMYASTTSNVMFYVVCTAINAENGANILSKNADGINGTICTATGNELVKTSCGSFYQGDQMCSPAPSSGYQKIGSTGTTTISSSVSVYGVRVRVSLTCNDPCEVIYYLHKGSTISLWRENYEIGSTKYNQFTTIVAEKYVPGYVSEQITSMGNTTYNGGWFGLSLCVATASNCIWMESNGCVY